MKKVEKLLNIIGEADYKLGDFKFPVVRAFVRADNKVFNFVVICYNRQVNKYGVMRTVSPKDRNSMFRFSQMKTVVATDDIDVANKRFNDLMKTERGTEINLPKINNQNYVDSLYDKLTK